MSFVEITQEGPVRTVNLNRPEKRNAMNSEMLHSLHAAFQSEPNAEERVTIIRSEGNVFCAGRDLKESTEGGTLVDVEPIFHAVETYPLPVIAIVQGAAIAGGCELALHCDFVIAADTAKFAMSLAQIGRAPTWFLAKKILEVAGPVGAREFFLLGDPLTAVQMHQLGMIARVAPRDELDAVAQPIVDRLIANAPLSMRAIKAVLLREMTFRDSIEHADLDAQVRTAASSKDAFEGMRARLEKREPNFRGE